MEEKICQTRVTCRMITKGQDWKISEERESYVLCPMYRAGGTRGICQEP